MIEPIIPSPVDRSIVHDGIRDLTPDELATWRAAGPGNRVLADAGFGLLKIVPHPGPVEECLDPGCQPPLRGHP